MMNMIKRPLVAIFLGLLAGSSHAVDQEVERLLSRMRNVYSSTMTARLVIKTTGPRFGKNTITTDLTYMKERRIYAKLSGFESLKGRTRIFVCDGQKISVDDFAGNPQLLDFNPDVIPLPINLEAMSFWDWKRQLSTSKGSNMEHSSFKLKKGVRWNNKSWWVLEEKADGQNVYVDYFIDPTTALIHRVQVYDIHKRNMITETVVAKVDRNIKVDPNLFKVKTGVRISVGKKIESGNP